jgi:hypothetical protein
VLIRHKPFLGADRPLEPASRARGARTIASMEGRDLGDRQFDALLERLDRIAEQLERIDGRLEQQEAVHHVVRELRSLNESLQALAYAALGQSPQVRRRSAG